MSDEIEDRLRSHARSFDGLLSLIPAKLYYGEDVSDQWNRKKQTPEQKRAAKMAKLDPDNWKSAKDVMDERSAAAKRKRNDEQPEGSDGGEQYVEAELPKVIQDQDNPKAKKRRTDGNSQSQPTAPVDADEKRKRLAEKKAAKKEKVQKEREKLQKRKARKQAEKVQREHDVDSEGGDDTALVEPIQLDPPSTTASTKAVDEESTASSSEGVPDILSPPAESGTSSISSLPLSITENPAKTDSKAKHQTRQEVLSRPLSNSHPEASQPQQSQAEREAARARLASAISLFRNARKADESAASKPRNRAELLEQRRQKEEARREAKKEQRRKEREEAARQADEEIARRFSPGGSGSLLASPRSPPFKDTDPLANNFSYGRIEFGDGSKVDSTNLDGMLDQRKKKGPQDVETALNAAKNKASRLAGLDEQKRKEIEDKDMWLNAKRRAHGERVKDDTSLLKKALKRQESQKKKSEKEWTERKEGVQKAQETKQKKRTDNLAKRKEEKHARKVGKKGKKVKRPGFEGSFRGRTGGSKKK